MRNATAATLASVATAALLAGCSTTVTGTATGISGAVGHGPGASAAIPSGLQTGNYPTTPRTIPANSSNSAWVAEGNRMGDALIQVNEVDPRMTIGGAALRSFPVLRGMQLSERVPDDTASAFSSASMRVGMTTTRGDRLENPTVAVRIGLYRFGTDADAKKAVDSIKSDSAGKRQIPIASAPGGIATEFKPGTVDSYLARGPIVINVSGTGPTTAAATGFVDKAFKLEIPKLDSFKPTPAAEVSGLPADEDGIMSRTLPYDSTEDPNPELSQGYLSYTGLLHRIQDISTADRYQRAGVDLVGQAGSVVYRTRDAGAAKDFAKGFYSSDKYSPASVPKQPAMRCARETSASSSYVCVVVVQRYVATVLADSLPDAQKKAAAQWVILTKAG
ncbi:hypothetical protein P0W64_17515 [Tsukamurella sp. 8F]|uniref:DUF7373 family lipoprotein n=1 Tax=unclassified Tsukamurella TaxID=2633480 RepID=UPI0023BA244B|nr:MULTISPECIES: hypothetical protein [unclassified Tsukamurella]MDF0530266.1 hypothetical protein [Tsukamurella sp. 8J]MDF0588584.1 hypothetical protein [Tsukamurella sp. 8F]